MSQLPRFRAALDEIVAYKPGRRVVGPDGRSHKLSSNENPAGPLPSVVSAIADAAAEVNRYPDNNATELVEKIATHYGVQADQVVVGCGSVGVSQMLLESVAESGVDVMYAWRSFEAYPILAGLAGGVSLQIPLRDFTHDLSAMADAITPKTRLIFVCNPNNPTGTVVRRAELEAFLDRVPQDCLVVLDEAYREYVRDVQVVDGMELLAGRPNLAVLRTFSKAYGLAGLRVGFLIGTPKVAESVRKCYLPFSVNRIAQAAAIASLDATDELATRVDATVKERERVREALLADGWTVPTTEANFVWLPTGTDTADFTLACEAAGVAVRPFATDGVRVSIGSAEENDAFLAVSRAFPKRA